MRVVLLVALLVLGPSKLGAALHLGQGVALLCSVVERLERGSAMRDVERGRPVGGRLRPLGLRLPGRAASNDAAPEPVTDADPRRRRPGVAPVAPRQDPRLRAVGLLDPSVVARTVGPCPWCPPSVTAGGGRMTLVEHLAELRAGSSRSRLLKSAPAIVAGMAVAWFAYEWIFDFLVNPLCDVLEDR